MTLIEMDPMLRRGIRLMLSKAPDALEQLKALAEEALVYKQRNATGKLSQEDIGVSLNPPKRQRLADPSTVSLSSVTPHTPSPTPSLKSDGGSSRGGSRRSDESDQEADMNDIALEITSGISCTVCKRIAFYSMNQLVECQDCHLIYHQDCHKPPISKADITDPRRVWYCAKCTRNMKKQTSSSSSSSSGVGSSTRSSSSANKSSASSSSRHVSSPSKPPSSSSSSSHASPAKGSSSQGGGGGTSSQSGSSRLSPFANLAAVSTRATIGGERGITTRGGDNKSSTSSGSSGSSSTSSSLGSRGEPKTSSSSIPPSAPSNTMLSAERRMQLMKKKAAAKMAERRKM